MWFKALWSQKKEVVIWRRPTCKNNRFCLLLLLTTLSAVRTIPSEISVGILTSSPACTCLNAVCMMCSEVAIRGISWLSLLEHPKTASSQASSFWDTVNASLSSEGNHKTIYSYIQINTCNSDNYNETHVNIYVEECADPVMLTSCSNLRKWNLYIYIYIYIWNICIYTKTPQTVERK